MSSTEKSKSIEVKSSVSEVTVFQGRAQITRTVKIQLGKGGHSLIFPELPAGIDPESLQVKGKGEAKLGECVFETEYFSENIDEKTRPLQEEKQVLEDRIGDIALVINSCNSEKNLVEQIARMAVTPVPPAQNSQGDQTVPKQMDPKAWTELIDFYHNKGSDIDTRKLKSEREIREINNRLSKINNELAALGNRSSRSRNIIRLNLEKEKEGEISIDLSYMIQGPSWYPVYNVRAETGSENVQIEYDAFVRQGTGEDWEDIRLKLSTARVNVSGIVPELYPWRLQFYRPAPAPAMGAMRSRAKKAMAMDSSKELVASEAMAQAPEEDYYEDEMQYDEAEVESGGNAVVFGVTGGSGIGGDNRDTRVSISRKEFPAEFMYATVPKLSPFAYLTAKIKNNADYPLLPGRVNVFFNSSLVGTSAFDLIMPDQEVSASLGVDEGIKVEYRFIKRFRKNEGLVNKKLNEQFEYMIRLTNNLKKETEIKVQDQFPISQDKEISVKILAPQIKDNQKNPRLDDENRITWKLDIGPGKTVELPVSFTVEYPQGSSVSGL